MSRATDKVMRRGAYSRVGNSPSAPTPTEQPVAAEKKPSPAAPPPVVESEVEPDTDQNLVEALSAMTEEELDKIPGFGKATIAEVISLREEGEPSVKQFLELLGENRFQKAKAYIANL